VPTGDDCRAIALSLPEAEELRELITEAWLMTAPKRLARELQE
jgi:hypothetical protein